MHGRFSISGAHVPGLPPKSTPVVGPTGFTGFTLGQHFQKRVTLGLSSQNSQIDSLHSELSWKKGTDIVQVWWTGACSSAVTNKTWMHWQIEKLQRVTCRCFKTWIVMDFSVSHFSRRLTTFFTDYSSRLSSFFSVGLVGGLGTIWE